MLRAATVSQGVISSLYSSVYQCPLLLLLLLLLALSTQCWVMHSLLLLLLLSIPPGTNVTTPPCRIAPAVA
jgi:hypothetical protein